MSMTSAKFEQYNGKLPKDAEIYSCTYKNVEEAKAAFLKDLEK